MHDELVRLYREPAERTPRVCRRNRHSGLSPRWPRELTRWRLRGRFLPSGATTEDARGLCRARRNCKRRVTRCGSLVGISCHPVVVATLLPLSALKLTSRRRQRLRQRHGTCRNTTVSGARTCLQGKRKEHIRYEYLHQQLGRSKR